MSYTECNGTLYLHSLPVLHLVDFVWGFFKLVFDKQ